MRKMIAYMIVVGLVVMAFSALSLSVSAEYVGDITIMADGTVDPADAPIEIKGIIYTLTDDIIGKMVIQMSGITLNGAGYTITGSGDGSGIFCDGLTGITIKNCIVDNFLNGLVLINCDASTIKENMVSRCVDSGIFLVGTHNSIVKENTCKNNVWEGIWLEDSSNNIIKENKLGENGESGIFLWNSCNNNLIKENIAWGNGWDPSVGGAAIFLYNSCNHNTIYKNDLSNKNSIGVAVFGSCNDNIVTENRIIKNDQGGIYVYYSYGNTVTKNIIFKCYTYGQCGIRVIFSGGNIFNQNSVSQCFRGILVRFNPTDNGNIITENSFRDNYRGMQFVGGGNNIIHHNNIIHNDIQVEDHTEGNQYDDGSEGNYWSDYKGKDADGDGIGDTPYMIYGSAGEQDDYPLMKAWKL